MQHKNHVVTKKDVILNSFQDLHRSFSTRGFTLIELLVVVLIIGILAAVAVPQYKKAVATTRFAQALPVLRSLAEANERFYLANGYYTTNWAELDISKPKTKSWEINYVLGNDYAQVRWAAKYELPSLYIYYPHADHRDAGYFQCNGIDTAFAAKLCAKYGEQILPWTPHWTRWPY